MLFHTCSITRQCLAFIINSIHSWEICSNLNNIVLRLCPQTWLAYCRQSLGKCAITILYRVYRILTVLDLRTQWLPYIEGSQLRNVHVRKLLGFEMCCKDSSNPVHQPRTDAASFSSVRGTGPGCNAKGTPVLYPCSLFLVGKRNDLGTRLTACSSWCHVGLARTHINPGRLQVVAVWVCHSTERLDSLDVLGFHFCQTDGRGEHGELSEGLDVCITLQLWVGGWRGVGIWEWWV